MFWEKISQVEINEKIKMAIDQNINYREQTLLGLPGTFLDEEQFYSAPFLEDSPFLATLINNPNHIGCHTFSKGKSEPFFAGTQKLEVEMLKICAEEILEGQTDEQDGYVAPGGTEANVQAIWIYRNYYQKEFNAKVDEVAIIYSQDSHYSMPKASNILGVKQYIVTVDNETRLINLENLDSQVKKAKQEGVKYFIIIQNMATTMFGSVDDIDATTNYLIQNKIEFKLHVDAAFGGFIYPFSAKENALTFKNKHITSFTLDGHKMLQTPYGTGIFIVRKGFMKYGLTDEAKYVSGKDYTISGSRSGANAVSLWMLLKSYGSMGWTVKMQKLLDKTTSLCHQLDKMNIQYYRNPNVNIVTIKAGFISEELAKKYHLIADVSDDKPKWWKIVVMQHVQQGMLDQFVFELKEENKKEKAFAL